jgi:hypothetical protein
MTSLSRLNMINPKTGDILPLDSFMLGAKLSKEAFLSTEAGKAAEELISNGPWVTFRAKLGDKYFALIVFHFEDLSEVCLSLATNYESLGAGSYVINEEERKKLHDDYMIASLGATSCCYAWGTIASILDIKGGSSQIIVRYIKS